MKREEFKALLATAADPDKGPAALAAISDEAENLYNTIDTMNTKAAEDAATIGKLRETNMQLFLRTATPSQETPPEKDAYEVLAEKIRSENNGNQ